MIFPSAKQQIKDAIMDNDFLKNIDASQVRELVDSMYSKSIAAGEFVIREGEVGAHLYVSAAGEFAVMQQGKVLDKMGPGKAFGELAILYNCTRTASIRVLSEAARVWVLDRRVFQQIMMCTGLQRRENSVRPGGVVPGTASPLRSSLHGLSIGFSLSIDGGTQTQGHARCDQKTRCLRRELRAVHATVLQHSHPQIRQGFQVNFNKFGIFY